MHFYRLLQSISQQLWLQENQINELEARINHLQDWQNRVLSTNIYSWPLCTSVGGDDFFEDISPVQTGENEDEEKEEEQEDLGKGFNGGNDKQKQRKKTRGRNDCHESTAKPKTKRRRALAPNIDQGQSPYYRNNFQVRRTNAPAPVIAQSHAGLNNCDVICYSNAIFQGIASCIHVSDFLQTPPNEEHQRFPLYYAFASVMSSMVSGQESVVDPTLFINLFRENHENYDPQEGMYFDSG